MNYVPTLESVRGKLARGGALFASDEMAVVLGRVDALEANNKELRERTVDYSNRMSVLQGQADALTADLGSVMASDLRRFVNAPKTAAPPEKETG